MIHVPDPGTTAPLPVLRTGQKPTMGDIAAHLGVSRQLVSIVLRDHPGASEATRERVKRAATELGYRPNIAARTLRQATSKSLGVVFVPTHATEPDIVASMYPAGQACGYNLVLSAETPTRTADQAVAELLGYRCEAIVLIGSALTTRGIKALARDTPVPIVNVGAGRRNDYYDVVRSAGDHGIADAVKHLSTLGHRDIAYIDSEAMPPASLRRAGYVRAMKTLGLPLRIVTVAGEYTEESGSIAARRLLADARMPTAVVAGNDQAALGAMYVFMAAGVAVPQSVSVTGFDDSRIARLSAINLSTVRQDAEEMGAAAVRAALRRVDDSALAPTELVIAPLLVVRGSTGAPRTSVDATRTSVGARTKPESRRPA
jgi:DNA-binding LacI/PurR family transcriptional regulator